MTLLPPTSAQHLQNALEHGRVCANPEAIPGPILLHTLRRTPPEVLSQYAGLEGGLAGRLCAAAAYAHTTDELFAAAATKKYTHATIRRAALYGCFGITADMLRRPPSYTVLLACTDRASALLRRAKKEETLPILSRPAAYKKESDTVQQDFLRALTADAVYGMLLPTPISEAELLAKTPTILRADDKSKPET